MIKLKDILQEKKDILKEEKMSPEQIKFAKPIFDAAAKKGGFLNKIYIEIFETYNLFTQDLLNVFNQRIVETNKVITEAKSTISSLKNSTIQNTEYNNEASAEEILDIFNLCLDVVNESLNKKSVSRNVKAQIAV